jgi:hypothetical protein
MPKYDYSRVPVQLYEALGRANADRDTPPPVRCRAYDAVQAAALVPERTRAELAEALLARMEACILPECRGSFEFSNRPAEEIRALVNEARTAPR